jgi:hypothetical protein
MWNKQMRESRTVLGEYETFREANSCAASPDGTQHLFTVFKKDPATEHYTELF